MQTGRPAVRAALLIAIMAMAVVANHDSYRSYFENDDFGTLNWARVTRFHEYVTNLPCLKYPCQQSRPTGFMLYGALWSMAKLNYTPWALAMLAIGLLNVALLWRSLRLLEFDEIATALGCLVFVAARALFDGWWKPMFIYDVLSTTFALLMLIAYIHKRWVLSFIALWLAMRTKEIAILLPAVLLCYEFTLGSRNWKRLIPFFIPAAIYGFYGIRFNQQQPHNPYTMTSAPAGLWRSISFYATSMSDCHTPACCWPLRCSSRATGAEIRSRRDRLRNRHVPTNAGPHARRVLYLAMTSVAIVIATLAAYHRRTVALLVIVWAAWQVTLIRKHAAVTIAEGKDRRAFAAALRGVPRLPVYLYQDAPASFGYFGGEYAIRVIEIRNRSTALTMSIFPWIAPAFAHLGFAASHSGSVDFLRNRCNTLRPVSNPGPMARRMAGRLPGVSSRERSRRRPSLPAAVSHGV